MLVVDDDDDIRALVVSALQLDGYDLIEARDGREALEIAPAPDLIVTDLCMPGVDGISLISGLRGVGCTTPIIVMTAHASPTVTAAVEHAGADVLFKKPFDVDDLRTAVMNMLPNRQ